MIENPFQEYIKVRRQIRELKEREKELRQKCIELFQETESSQVRTAIGDILYTKRKRYCYSNKVRKLQAEKKAQQLKEQEEATFEEQDVLTLSPQEEPSDYVLL